MKILAKYGADLSNITKKAQAERNKKCSGWFSCFSSECKEAKERLAFVQNKLHEIQKTKQSKNHE